MTSHIIDIITEKGQVILFDIIIIINPNNLLIGIGSASDTRRRVGLIKRKSFSLLDDAKHRALYASTPPQHC